MVGRGVTLPCARGGGPLLEASRALGATVIDHGLGEPAIELGGGCFRRRTELRQVVEGGHATAHDEHAFVTQRCERPADGDVFGRVEAALEGELDDGDVGCGERDDEGDERAVVVAALRVAAYVDAGRAEEFDDALGQVGRPRRRVAGR